MSNTKPCPPRWPLQVLRRLLKARYLEEIEGDLEERFQDNIAEYNLHQARRLYLTQSGCKQKSVGRT
ncbi:MAG: permease prefix domain 2-containing transporter [Bacteroidota bacterium]